MDIRERIARIARGESVPSLRDTYSGPPGVAEAVFEQIAAAARIGARAPQRDELPPGASYGLRTLVEQGRIRIEIYALNYRVFEIRKGDLKGMRTQAPPKQAPPWKVIG